MTKSRHPRFTHPLARWVQILSKSLICVARTHHQRSQLIQTRHSRPYHQIQYVSLHRVRENRSCGLYKSNSQTMPTVTSPSTSPTVSSASSLDSRSPLGSSSSQVDSLSSSSMSSSDLSMSNASSSQYVLQLLINRAS